MTQSRSNNKVLVFIIFLLLLTNIAVLAYFLFLCKKPAKKPDNKDGFAAVLRKEVGFNDEQVAKFNELKKSHWSDAKAKMDQIIHMKNILFDLTKVQDTVDATVLKWADSIASLQKQVEINSFRHVVQTRKICTPEQQVAYDSLMKKIINKGRTRKPGDGPIPGSR